MQKLRIFVNISIIIALYYIIYYIYLGLINPIPIAGDSWDYHIPISQTILNGTFLHPSGFKMGAWYFPGSSEAINSLFILFHIPLTLSNIAATIVLFFSCWKLAETFRLDRYFGLLFAITFITLNAVVRWQNAISIDIWVGVFFTLAIILLENPQRRILYFLELGFVLGMLAGSKYSVWFFILPLSIFYLKKLMSFVSLKRLAAFALPFSTFGLFWYIRNFIYTKNPFYPLSAIGFEGIQSYKYSMWNGITQHPLTMFDAVFGEYKIWILSVFVAVFVLGYNFVIKKNFQFNSLNKLFAIGIINFFFFMTFPTSEQPWIMVSSFRYSYPVFIPLMLGVFLLASKYKKEELIGYIAIANMINVVSMAYYPKLILIYLPIALLVYLILEKRNWIYVSKIKKVQNIKIIK